MFEYKMILNTTNLQEIRNHIQKSKKQDLKEEIIVRAGDEEFNRKVLEIKGVDILLSPELHNRKDKLKQRDSGLNEYLCKLAKQNNIKIGINLQEIKSLPTMQKAKTLSRIIQNINLCKRTKTDILIWSKTRFSKHDIRAFMLSLKSSTEMAKKASN